MVRDDLMIWAEIEAEREQEEAEEAEIWSEVIADAEREEEEESEIWFEIMMEDEEERRKKKEQQDKQLCLPGAVLHPDDGRDTAQPA